MERFAVAPQPAVALARGVLLEARRGGLPWLALAAVAAVVAIAGFLSRVALTDGAAVQASVCAALLRAGAVFLVAAHVAASFVRESNDKGLELFLARPVSRTAYYLGKLAGYALCAALLAAVFSVPLLVWSPPGAVVLWAISLALETVMVAAAALFFASALGQLVPALAATAGFYLLARAMDAIRVIASGPYAGDGTGDRIARWIADALALVLPRLDDATRAAWLIYGTPPAASYLAVLAGLAVYTALLAAAGLFDFHRGNL